MWSAKQILLLIVTFFLLVLAWIGLVAGIYFLDVYIFNSAIDYNDITYLTCLINILYLFVCLIGVGILVFIILQLIIFILNKYHSTKINMFIIIICVFIGIIIMVSFSVGNILITPLYYSYKAGSYNLLLGALGLIANIINLIIMGIMILLSIIIIGNVIQS